MLDAFSKNICPYAAITTFYQYKQIWNTKLMINNQL